MNESNNESQNRYSKYIEDNQDDDIISKIDSRRIKEKQFQENDT